MENVIVFRIVKIKYLWPCNNSSTFSNNWQVNKITVIINIVLDYEIYIISNHPGLEIIACHDIFLHEFWI